MEIFIIIAISFIILISSFALYVMLKAKSPESEKTAQAKVLFDSAVDVVKSLAESTVGKLEQVVASELRKKVNDGSAERTDLFALANEAYKEIIDSLDKKLFQSLAANVADVELFIRNEIERQVLLLKSKLNGGTD